MILKESLLGFDPDAVCSDMWRASNGGSKLFLQSDFFLEEIEEWKTEEGQLLVRFIGKKKFEEVYFADEIFTK